MIGPSRPLSDDTLMGSMHPAHRWSFRLAALLALFNVGGIDAQESSLPRTATTAEIVELIRKLGDERYTTRTDATRRLCALGPPVTEHLTRAVHENPGETALRAAQLLSIFDRCFFWGAEVEVSFSAPTIRWDEPVDLIVRFQNRGSQPVRLPFEPLSVEPGTRLSDAQQVGVMVDLADFIHVVDPSGTVIESPTVDDLADDAEVQAVIDARAEQTGASQLPAGQELMVRVENFSRGWARYPLLESGTYQVSFEYQPDWKDEPLQRAEVGRVVSGRASLEVTAAAPPTISRAGAVASLEVITEENRVAVYLVNHHDKSVLIHTGFGENAPFAQFVWSCIGDDEREIDVPLPGLKRKVTDFRLSDLRAVGPGERVRLAETTRVDLFANYARKSKGTAPAQLQVRASYHNLVTRNWQRREKVLDDGDAWPAELRTLLPPRMLGTRLSSEPLVLDAPSPAVDSVTPDE